VHCSIEMKQPRRNGAAGHTLEDYMKRCLLPNKPLNPICHRRYRQPIFEKPIDEAALKFAVDIFYRPNLAKRQSKPRLTGQAFLQKFQQHRLRLNRIASIQRQRRLYKLIFCGVFCRCGVGVYVVEPSVLKFESALDLTRNIGTNVLSIVFDVRQVPVGQLEPLRKQLEHFPLR